MDEIETIRKFYLWFYWKIDFSAFCRILGKPETDSWAKEKWDLARTHFMNFVLTDLVESFVTEWQKTKE